MALKLITRLQPRSKPRQPQVTENEAKEMLNQFSDIFSGLGCIKVDATIHIDSTIPPVINPPRRIPNTIADAVKEELDHMIKLGVIVEQKEPTPWVNSIMIVKKPNKICICLDPTKLNKAILRGLILSVLSNRL